MSERNQRFDSFEQWVNKASSRLTRRGEHVKAICFDQKGRLVRNGGDMMRARDEDAFPVEWLWPEQAVEAVMMTRSTPATAEGVTLLQRARDHLDYVRKTMPLMDMSIERDALIESIDAAISGAAQPDQAVIASEIAKWGCDWITQEEIDDLTNAICNRLRAALTAAGQAAAPDTVVWDIREMARKLARYERVVQGMASGAFLIPPADTVPADMRRGWMAASDCVQKVASNALTAAGQATPSESVKAPASCPHCIDERDCSTAPVCAAVEDAYRGHSPQGAPIDDK